MAPNGRMRVRDIELRARAVLPDSPEDVIYVNKHIAFLLNLDKVAMQIAPARMVELGIFHGGSAIYWQHRLALQCLSVFDIAPGAQKFEDYVRRHHLEGTVRAHFGVAQEDVATVRRLVDEDMKGEPIDLVIDDASHMYAPTLASFECLFPLIRPGGAYIIEDWAWGHDQKWPVETWREHPLLSPLIVEAMLACANLHRGIIDRIDIDKYYAVLWRGDTELPQDGSFRLKDHYLARGFALPKAS